MAQENGTDIWVREAAAPLIKIVDGVFLVGLTCMTAAGFMMVYTVW